MRPITPDSFAILCFCVLMQNDQGIVDKSPDYIAEKTHLMRSGYTAFAALDIYNMRKVVMYCDRWGIELPAAVAEEMQRQEGAMSDLQGKGFDF